MSRSRTSASTSRTSPKPPTLLTDYFGFLQMAARIGCVFRGKKVVILGTGGASRTVQAAAADGGAPVIGFGAESGRADDTAYGWPAYFPGQFAELVRALQATGAVFRAVIGPADERERQLCRKSVLRTYDVRNIDAAEYIGCPVRARFLLRLPRRPGVRLRAVLSSALPAARLVHLGAMDEPSIAAIWAQPLALAPVLPDLAVRFLMLEPELQESVIGA